MTGSRPRSLQPVRHGDLGPFYARLGARTFRRRRARIMVGPNPEQPAVDDT